MKLSNLLKSFVRLQIAATLSILMISTSQAQQTFIKSIGELFDEVGYSLLQKENGDFVAAGYMTTNNGAQEDYYLIKTDADGNPEWSRSFGGNLTDMCISVIATNDNGYLMCGESKTPGTGIYSAYLIKTDSSGIMQWQKKYYGDYEANGRGVVQIDDSGYIFCGSTWAEPNGQSDVYLVKINLEGDTIWTKKFGGPEDDWPQTMVSTNDGGLAICGSTRNTQNGVENIYVIKTDAQGNLLWENNYGSPTYDLGKKIIETSDGGLVVCGQSTNSNAGYLDFIVLRINNDGDEIWQKYFGSDDAAWGMSIAETSDAGFVACGAIRKSGSENISVWLVKVDENGIEEWNKQIGIVENQKNFGMDIINTNAGGLAICGYTKAVGTLQWMNLLLITTDEFGVVTSIIPIQKTDLEQLNVSPNPNLGKFNLEIPNGASDIHIFNSQGLIVFEENLVDVTKNSKRCFDFSSFKKGLYFITLTADGKEYCGKVQIN
jgi:hypothetical protein